MPAKCVRFRAGQVVVSKVPLYHAETDEVLYPPDTPMRVIDPAIMEGVICVEADKRVILAHQEDFEPLAIDAAWREWESYYSWQNLPRRILGMLKIHIELEWDKFTRFVERNKFHD